MLIQAVIFDFGGVLVRTADYLGRRKWEARLGLPERGLDRVVFDSEVAGRATVGQAPTEAVWQHVADTFGLGEAQMLEFRRDFWSGDRLDAELVDFIRRLRPRYKTAILSNAWPDARRAFTETFGLGGAVDEMIISAEEGVAKPAARIYHIAAERLGVPPAAAIFVDDMRANVEAAREVGMHAIRFQDTAQVIAAVEAQLDRPAG